MKRSERHRLKENELTASVARMRDALARRQREITAVIVVVVILALGAAGYVLWQQRANARAAELLAAALVVSGSQVVPETPPDPEAEGEAETPAPPPGTFRSERERLEAALPRFLEAADAYPSTASGIAARYHAAAVLAALDRVEEAEAHYREAIDRAGRRIYGQMARLGLAEVYRAAGRHEAAIELYREVAANPDGRVPLDGVLMQLGRAYATAGQTGDAVDTFTRIIDEFPQSLYAPEARREVEQLQASPGA